MRSAFLPPCKCNCKLYDREQLHCVMRRRLHDRTAGITHFTAGHVIVDFQKMLYCSSLYARQ
jgi:hypothetical protein